MVVIGGIIGSGIFINPYIVAQRLDSSPLVLGAWVAGGLIALAGAFAYAELGAIFPKAGGQYVYLRDGWHPLVGFMYGWALLLLIESGAIAAVAITFATYALRLVGRPDAAPVPLAIAAIASLSLVNYFGVKPGSRVLNVFVVLKVAALAIIIVAGALAPSSAGWWSGARTSAAPASALLAFGAALVPILFAYGGWQNANYIAEEIDNPRRNLPLSLLVGTLAVVVDLRDRQRRLPARARARGTGGHDDAGVEGGGVHVRDARRSVRDRGDCDLDLRLPRPGDPGADARLLRDGGGRRVFLPALSRLHPPTRRPGSRFSSSQRGRACWR